MSGSQWPKGWFSPHVPPAQLPALHRVVASTSRPHSARPANSTAKDEGAWKISRAAVVVIALVLTDLCTPGLNAAHAEMRAIQPSGVPAFPEALAKYHVHPWEMLRFPEFRAPYRRALGPTTVRWLSRLEGPANLNTTVQLAEGTFVLIDVCKPDACDTDRALILFRPQPAALWGLLFEGTSQRYIGNPPGSARSALKQRAAAN